MALNASEVEFFAEDTLVEIVPKFTGDALEMLSGTVGPFIPQTPTEVPLWLAVALKGQGKCVVRTPDWLRKERLTEVRLSERSSSMHTLKPLPEHYVEVASILLQHCSGELEDASELRSLLEDIESLRQHKIRKGLQAMAEEQTEEPVNYLKLNNASAMEMNAIRPMLLGTLGEFYKMYALGSAAITNGRQYREDLEDWLEQQDAADAQAEHERQEQEQQQQQQQRIMQQRPNSNRTVVARQGVGITNNTQQTHLTQSQYDSDDDALLLKNNSQDNDSDDGVDLRAGR